jgi:hypothetical protein
MANPVVDPLLKKLGDPTLLEKLTRSLSPSELNSLLMEVLRVKAEQNSPAALMKAYAENRFVKPSDLDALSFHDVEGKVLKLGQDTGFQPMEFSPLAPLGSCSALALVNQNKVVSALRGTEVVADITNVMALEAATQRVAGKFDTNHIHLCAVHRHVRAQALPPVKGFTAHFKIFCALTAGKDTGSFEFEIQTLAKHLQLYWDVLNTLGMTGVSIILKVLDEPSHETFAQAIQTFMEANLKHLNLSLITVPKDEHNYYQRLRFSINMTHKGNEINIGDGGFLNWTQRLTNNKKERMMASGVGLELMLKIMKGLR